jgi:hypothetical protein
MKIKLAIPDQSDALATFDRLANEAAQLATAANPAPKPTGSDLLADCDALESFVAQARVRNRLATVPPRTSALPSPAIPPASKAPAVTASAPGVKLTATQRAMAAAPKPATTPRTLTATAPKIPTPPARQLSATEKCLAAKAPKAKPAMPAPAAKAFVPLPAEFSNPEAALRDAQNQCVNLEIGLKFHGQTFSRPALTGDNAADVAALIAYRAALQATFLSIRK